MVDDPQQVIDAAAIVAEIAYSEFTHAEKSYHFKRQGLPPQHVRMGVPIAKRVPARPGSRRRRRYTHCSRRRPRRSTGGGSRAAPRAAAPSARRPRASPRAPLQRAGLKKHWVLRYQIRASVWTPGLILGVMGCPKQGSFASRSHFRVSSLFQNHHITP